MEKRVEIELEINSDGQTIVEVLQIDEERKVELGYEFIVLC